MINHNKKKVVLVLGGSGLLGTHFQHFMNEKYKVISTYHSINPNIPGSINFNALNSTLELDLLLEKTKPDIIINTIAYVTVDGCEEDPSLAKELNVKFVTNLVISMSKNGLNDTHLIHISSDSVYGNSAGQKNHRWIETDPLNPLSVYAKTKLQSETEANKHNGPVLVLRTAFYGINPNSKKSLLWWIINNAKHGNEMDAWENIFFSPVSAMQLVIIIEYLLEKNIIGIFNVGSVDGCNKFDFVYNVCSKIGLKPKINRIINRNIKKQDIRPDNSMLCSDRLYEILPWSVYWREDLTSYMENMLPLPKD